MTLIKKLFPLIYLGCITLVIHLSVQSFYQILGTYVPKSYDSDSPIKQFVTTAQPQRLEPFSNYDPIARRNLFQTKTQAEIKKENAPPPPKPVEEEPIKPTELKLKLLGTVAGDSKHAYAVILDQRKRQQNLYRVGDPIQTAIVDEIRRGSVILKVGNGKEILTMDEDPGMALSNLNKSKARQPQKPSTDGKIMLSRRDLHQSMRNINQLMSQIRIRPHFNRGRPDGLSVNNIKRQSIFNKMGLRNGDIIQGVNGKK
ncbi:MAG: general secretion pathway protein C [Candidatus Magnetoglobus multicellularis str. Araruama]|uniref:General secretion pathway protein C n=1 Tax=Candidatus Magnetoglobus multicellularis str. Araruama TaxID=890399 RepID=A0A1V1PG17_9BACT|nr:MAG: general secretion pathway protein C [Candidatus Magnetoglobus multicellularis str. Araruama]